MIIETAPLVPFRGSTAPWTLTRVMKLHRLSATQRPNSETSRIGVLRRSNAFYDRVNFDEAPTSRTNHLPSLTVTLEL